jgi:hypothetical protein
MISEKGTTYTGALSVSDMTETKTTIRENGSALDRQDYDATYVNYIY